MASNNQKLGDYIEILNRRNSDLRYNENDVRGISNTKHIMDTRARMGYTDLDNFYVIKPGEFIFNPRTSRNGEKIGIVFNDTTETYIFSFNNIAFRIKEVAKELLYAPYLYLFFSKPEFDKYARYNSWGSATELFNWQDMCDVEINLPDIEEQRKIVKEYQTIQNRIKLLEQENEKLEEFSMLNYQNIINDELIEKTISNVEAFGEFCRGKNITAEQMKMGAIPVISAGLKPSGYHNESNVASPSITISGSGVNAGFISFHTEDIWASDCSFCNNSKYIHFLYLSLKYKQEEIMNLQKGSAQPHVYPKDINPLEIISPSNEYILQNFEKNNKHIFSLIGLHKKEIIELKKLESLIIMNI